MKNCPNCNKLLADNAESCDKCGFQFTTHFDIGEKIEPINGSNRNERVKYCTKCGAQNPFPTTACNNCGSSNFRTTPNFATRPDGITVIAALGIFGGILDIIGGLISSFLIPFAFFVFLIIGIIFIFSSVSLLSGRNWSRILLMFFSVLSLLAFPFGTLIGIIFLYYLTRPNVEAYFHRDLVTKNY